MKPVLLMIPGMLNDEEVWADVAPALIGHAEPRVADVRGPASIAEAADAAWRLLDDVPASTPLVIAGFSMGGYVAIDMLARRRRAVQGAALLSTSARPESPEGAAARAKTLRALRADFPKAVERIVQWSTEQPDEALVERLRRMMLRVGAPAAIRQTEAIMARTDHRDALSRLALPVQVMCGAQDRLTPSELSCELAALIPGSQLHIVEGSGHMLPCERPKAVADALLQLLG